MIVFDIDLRVTFDALLGGDQDDAVGGTGTVDGSRCRILEDLEGSDVVRIQVVDVAHWYVVHDIKGIRTGTESGGTSDADGGTFTGRTGIRGDLNACCSALHSLKNIGRRLGHDCIGVYGRDGSGQVTFLDGAVTDDDDVVESRRLFADGEIDGGLTRVRHFHGLVTDAGEEECVTGLYIAQRPFAVSIRDRAVVGPFDLDDGAFDRLAVLVQDRTSDPVLRIQRQAEAEQGQTEAHEGLFRPAGQEKAEWFTVIHCVVIGKKK